MADLTNTMRWLHFPPDLLGNRALERPFYFEVAASLSKEAMRAADAAMSQPGPSLEPVPELAKDATPEQQAAHAELEAAHDEAVRVEVINRYAAALEPHVRMGKEPLVVNGQRITTLLEYFDFVTTKLTGTAAFFEVPRAFHEANVLDTRQLFSSGRPSGGFISTTTASNARVNGQTVAR